MRGPLFSFYGAKWRLVPKYPAPGRRIVELFAGSACYASRYSDREVLLVERDPLLAQLWRWLIAVTPGEVRALPNLDVGARASELPVCQEAKWLIGFTMNAGSAFPRQTFSVRHRRPLYPRFSARAWWARQREQTARGVAEIKHWRLFEGDWFDAPHAIGATYFVDPPYQWAGKHYRHSYVDYGALRDLCETLSASGSQVIVCENYGANWLPFRRLATVKATPKKDGRQYSIEVTWP